MTSYIPATFPSPRHRVLCCDYDGTLARDGVVPDVTVAALTKVAASGMRLLMATGRTIEELEVVFPHCRLFDRIVAENGALLVDPVTRRTRRLATPPPQKLLGFLAAHGVAPLSVGHVIVATLRVHEAVVRKAIADLDLNLHIIANKESLMVLPVGVNKGSGMLAALDELSLVADNVIGVGDAENDIAFFDLCGISVAVANALPGVKESADFVTAASCGAGVIEVVEAILGDSADTRGALHASSA